MGPSRHQAGRVSAAPPAPRAALGAATRHWTRTLLTLPLLPLPLLLLLPLTLPLRPLPLRPLLLLLLPS
ncbi:hypothetical protein, partial [Agrobacterium sp.]|uniref:hypothetical protein n=1 Tax=Agrobacterium sp. TaxID=361 RepID=UPI0040335BE5